LFYIQKTGSLPLLNVNRKGSSPWRRRTLPFLLLFLLCFSSALAAAERTLGPGDRLGITVWGEKDLTQQVEVRADGKIAYPLLGDLNAVGKTAKQLQNDIEKGLKEYLHDPKVEVAVSNYADVAVYVLGEVVKPGAYAVPRGGGIMEVIALAGGLQSTADKEANLLRADRQLIRVNLRELVEAERSGTAPQLEPGDVLIVPFRSHPEEVAVMGRVLKPGMYPFTAGMRLMDALSLAGIPEKAALAGQPTRPDLNKVILTRSGESRELDVLAMLQQGDLRQNEALLAGDIITVPETARRRIYTFGAFKSPGVYYLDADQGLLEVVLASGGPAEGAKLDKATVVRMVNGKQENLIVDLNRLISKGDASQNIALESGDILFLPGGKKGGFRLENILPFLPYLAF
jgi:polysaccharide export outer membrane protein